MPVLEKLLELMAAIILVLERSQATMQKSEPKVVPPAWRDPGSHTPIVRSIQYGATAGGPDMLPFRI